MRPLLHIPDGFLAPQVALTLWVATAVVIGIALRRIGQRGPAAASQTILMGLSGAFIFAAQMFNFPVAAGTSGHLLGGVLAGFLLGPWAGSVVMATVIGIQALLFQDGGLLALGANIFNMGVIGTLGGTLVARGIAATLGNARRATLLGVGVAAWLSVMAAAGFTTLQLGLSGTTDISIGLPAMLGTHALIGLGEALISVSAISFIAVSAPEIFAKSVPAAPTSPRRRVVAGLLIAGTTVSLASLFASTSPDGLERVATDLGFINTSQAAPFELFADYSVPGFSGVAGTALAGVIGALVVLLLIVLLNRLASARKSS
ncbi:MAG: cobalamin biosynthesis protein CbiM [Chloroflexi bacterium]|nr:MAG: cobalamin biosynthesis protein CbiM [Chloroflexota bacterium]